VVVLSPTPPPNRISACATGSYAAVGWKSPVGRADFGPSYGALAVLVMLVQTLVEPSNFQVSLR
jgi:hypothetical protein